jgi:hypothetical protein
MLDSILKETLISLVRGGGRPGYPHRNSPPFESLMTVDDRRVILKAVPSSQHHLPNSQPPGLNISCIHSAYLLISGYGRVVAFAKSMSNSVYPIPLNIPLPLFILVVFYVRYNPLSEHQSANNLQTNARIDLVGGWWKASTASHFGVTAGRLGIPAARKDHLLQTHLDFALVKYSR